MTSSSRFAFFIGPTCVGKGFIMKLIKEFTFLVCTLGILRINFISFGDIVKGLLETDPNFKERYAESMARGDLVDDPKAIEIFQKEIDRLMEIGQWEFILVDGFCRSVPQIAYAQNKGYLTADTKVFMIEASQATCLERFLHRKKTADKKRIDAEIETFHKRYHLHVDTAPALRAMFKDSDCTLIDIDGEGDIVGKVSVDIKNNLHQDFASAASKGIVRLHQSLQTSSAS